METARSSWIVDIQPEYYTAEQPTRRQYKFALQLDPEIMCAQFMFSLKVSEHVCHPRKATAKPNSEDCRLQTFTLSWTSEACDAKKLKLSHCTLRWRLGGEEV
jgi:hypothetical protein